MPPDGDQWPNDVATSLMDAFRDFVGSDAIVGLIRNLLIEHGRIASTIDVLTVLPHAVDRVTVLTSDTILHGLSEITPGNPDQLNLIRDLFLDPHPHLIYHAHSNSSSWFCSKRNSVRPSLAPANVRAVSLARRD